MDNRAAGHGMLGSVMEGIRGETLGEILEITADKDYGNEADMVKCLEKGIIPHVIIANGRDGYELEIPYEEAEKDITSTESIYGTPEEMLSRAEGMRQQKTGSKSPI